MIGFGPALSRPSLYGRFDLAYCGESRALGEFRTPPNDTFVCLGCLCRYRVDILWSSQTEKKTYHKQLVQASRTRRTPVLSTAKPAPFPKPNINTKKSEALVIVKAVDSVRSLILTRRISPRSKYPVYYCCFSLFPKWQPPPPPKKPTSSNTSTPTSAPGPPSNTSPSPANPSPPPRPSSSPRFPLHCNCRMNCAT